MGVEVKLQTRGHVGPEDVRDVAAAVSGRDAVVVRDHTASIGDESIRYFTVEFRDPENRRKVRELRGHHSEYGADSSDCGSLGEGPYTYLALGGFGGAAAVLRAVAERFGGELVDETVSEEPELFDFPDGDGAPRPH